MEETPNAPVSRWGQLNAGQTYTILADDVLVAFSLAKFTQSDWPVLGWLFVRSWGRSTRRKSRATWPEAIPVPWSPTLCARETNRLRQKVQNSKTSLVASCVILETPEGLVINKHADEWIYPPGHPKAGQRRLSPLDLTAISLVQMIQMAAPKAEIPYPVEVTNPAPPYPVEVTAVTATGYECNPQRLQPYPVEVTDVTATGYSAYKERARIEIKEDLNTDFKKKEEDADPLPDSEEKESSIKLPDPKAWFFQPGNHRYSEADGHDLFRIAYTHFPGTRIPEDVYERQQWFSLDVWRHALTFSKRAKPTLGLNGNGGVAYVRSIAQRIVDGEIKPEEPPKPGIPGVRTIPLSRAQERTAELKRQLEERKQQRLRAEAERRELKHG